MTPSTMVNTNQPPCWVTYDNSHAVKRKSSNFTTFNNARISFNNIRFLLWIFFLFLVKKWKQKQKWKWKTNHPTKTNNQITVLF